MIHGTMFLVTFFCLSLSLSASVLAQVTGSVTGKVLDAASDLPLADANAFIANTTLGAASDAQGTFVITNIPPGTFEVVVSVIGYQVEKRTIRIAGGRPDSLIFRLGARILEAPAVEVSAKQQRQWRQQLKKFRSLFLGTTENASQCKFENPYVLDFTEKDGRFTASASEPVVIINRALGYRVVIFLEFFETSGELIRYSGVPRFEELPPKNKWAKAEWERNRIKAYRGSLRHFLAALCRYYDMVEADETKKAQILNQDELEQKGYDGFQVYEVENPWTKKTIHHAEIAKATDLLRPGDRPNERKLNFHHYLDITYLDELEESQYRLFLNEHRGLRPQRSLVKLNVDTLVMNKSGTFHVPFGLRTYGYWAWEKVAEMLPFDYMPPASPSP